MTSPSAKVTLLVQGKDFLLSSKLLLNQMAQFGANGRELVDGVRRKPQLPLQYSSISEEGKLQSTYRLNEERTENGRLSF